jgi:PAS domain S-box-containing protein
VRQTLDRMERRENDLLDRRQRAARAAARATDSIVISGSVIGVLLLSVAAWSAAREAARRRSAENVLRMSEERLRLLLESVRDYAIFLLDPRGRILTWPDSAKRLKGYAADEVVGASHAIFYTPEDVSLGVPEEFLEATRLEGRAENEGWRVRKDGSRFWADVVMTAVVSDGEVVGFAKVTRDMTERRAAEERISALHERLRRQTAELESANAELQTFCYSVSHDLRSPLRAIDGFSQALLEDAAPRLDEAGRRLLGRVRAAAGRMGDLIDALLDLSRVTRQPLDRAKVDLSDLARSVAAELARSEPGRSASVEIAPGLEAEGDPRLLRLVLQNLLGNAWKFTSGKPAAAIAFGAEGSDPAVYFVKDDGAGFDMRYAEQLFAPFQRLHGAEFPGTGIGLATVARIVQRHGGKIWAEGKVGEGATFYFTI